MVLGDDKGGTARGRISPDRFYSKEKEKTKLNWFLFEFALELEQLQVLASPGL